MRVLAAQERDARAVESASRPMHVHRIEEVSRGDRATSRAIPDGNCQRRDFRN